MISFMAEEISENEINSFLEDLRNAQEDGFIWGFLKKGNDATKNVASLGIDAIKSVEPLAGRAVYHINRLLESGRSTQERAFGLSLIEYSSELMGQMDHKSGHATRATVSGEGSDCCLWWTLSPYIFSELEPKVGEKEAVKLLLEWSQSGKPHYETEEAEVNLRGLGIYNYAGFNGCTFTLGKDPEGKSHQFAKKEAQRLIRDVFKTQP